MIACGWFGSGICPATGAIITPDDIWEIVRTLVKERRKRGIEPTLTTLRDVMLETQQSPDDRRGQARMREMHELIDMVTGRYQICGKWTRGGSCSS